MMSREDIEAAEALLGVTFRKKELLEQALTHRSLQNESRGEKKKHNERLELLGDSIIEIVVTEYLFRNYPEAEAGQLAKIRSALVSTASLKKVAVKLGFMKFWQASSGEKKDLLSARGHKLKHEADTYEAIVAAIHLDRGMISAEAFVLDTLIQSDVEGVDLQDPKTLLQQAVQAQRKMTPMYRLVREWGSDHDRTYEVAVFIGKDMVAKAEGKSQKEASVAAAQKALQDLQQD